MPDSPSPSVPDRPDRSDDSGRSEPSGRSRLLATVRVALIVTWCGVLFFVLLGTVTTSPLRLPFPVRMNTVAMAPEGWAFFTRDAKEPVIVVHKQNPDSGRWEELDLANFTSGNAWGLRRSSRLLTTELALMMGGTPKEAWVAMREDVHPFLEAHDLPVISVHRPDTRLPALCGEVAVQVRERVPWAWSTARDRVRMPSRIARMDVHCEEEPPDRDELPTASQTDEPPPTDRPLDEPRRPEEVS